MKPLLSPWLVLLFLYPSVAQEVPTVNETLEVNLVELDVKVTNLSGELVKDLTADDFTVWDGGKRYEIDSFEEVVVPSLPETSMTNYRPRVMILLDAEMTSWANMELIIPQIRDMIRRNAAANREIGLAVNAKGVQLYQEFTTDPDAVLEALDRVRAAYEEIRTQWSFMTRVTGSNKNESQNRGEAEYLSLVVQEKLRALRGFITYLGAYSGTKNLILISDIWPTLDPESSVLGVQAFDLLQLQAIDELKKIQNAGLLGKVTINVVNTRVRLERDFAFDEGIIGRPLGTPLLAENVQGGPNQQKELADLTGGFHYFPNNITIEEMVDKVIGNNEHYYRIRYYATKSKGFRRVRVNVKGFGRSVHTTGGYFGSAATDGRTDADFDLVEQSRSRLKVNMSTDWLTWTRGKKRTYTTDLVVGQRAYDEQGNLAREKVTTVSLTKKGRKREAPFVGTLDFTVPNKQIALVEAVIIDMASGRRTVIRESGATAL